MTDIPGEFLERLKDVLGTGNVLTDPAEAEQRLASVADAFLHHDRPILRPADDPVFRIIAGTPRPLRLGRGCAPNWKCSPAAQRRTASRYCPAVSGIGRSSSARSDVVDFDSDLRPLLGDRTVKALAAAFDIRTVEEALRHLREALLEEALETRTGL